MTTNCLLGAVGGVSLGPQKLYRWATFTLLFGVLCVSEAFDSRYSFFVALARNRSRSEKKEQGLLESKDNFIEVKGSYTAMPGKTSEGFVKAAQKKKFVRNRDLKLKDSELRKEAHVQHVMVEGICDKCREKLQWRFKYNKYKSLTRPGSCQSCKNKTITKAYRTYCDVCAKKHNVCPGCCGNIKEINAYKKAQRDAADAQGEGGDGSDDDDGGSYDKEEEENAREEISAAEESLDNEKKKDEDEVEDNVELGNQDDDGQGVPPSESGEIIQNTMALVSDRNFRKMEDYGKSKYDRNRVVGSQHDKDVVSVFNNAPN